MWLSSSQWDLSRSDLKPQLSLHGPAHFHLAAEWWCLEAAWKPNVKDSRTVSNLGLWVMDHEEQSSPARSPHQPGHCTPHLSLYPFKAYVNHKPLRELLHVGSACYSSWAYNNTRAWFISELSILSTLNLALGKVEAPSQRKHTSGRWNNWQQARVIFNNGKQLKITLPSTQIVHSKQRSGTVWEIQSRGSLLGDAFMGECSVRAAREPHADLNSWVLYLRDFLTTHLGRKLLQHSNRCGGGSSLALHTGPRGVSGLENAPWFPTTLDWLGTSYSAPWTQVSLVKQHTCGWPLPMLTFYDSIVINILSLFFHWFGLNLFFSKNNWHSILYSFQV